MLRIRRKFKGTQHELLHKNMTKTETQRRVVFPKAFSIISHGSPVSRDGVCQEPA
jgi:hypothetical protein